MKATIGFNIAIYTYLGIDLDNKLYKKIIFKGNILKQNRCIIVKYNSFLESMSPYFKLKILML